LCGERRRMEKSERSYNFVKSLEFTLPWECGRKKDGSLNDIVHYLDKGQPTKYGIWQGANPDVDVPNLTLDGAIEIYKDRYWLVYDRQKHYHINMDVAEIGLAVTLFDTGVNVGVNRAWGWMRSVWTLDPKEQSRSIIRYREEHYANLKKSQPENYRGWLNRVNDLKKYVAVLRAA
jgi:hypothetical protein